jgi:hypothetical protein
VIITARQCSCERWRGQARYLPSGGRPGIGPGAGLDPGGAGVGVVEVPGPNGGGSTGSWNSGGGVVVVVVVGGGVVVGTVVVGVGVGV